MECGIQQETRIGVVGYDPSSSTYLQQDVGYVPQTQDRVIQKSFITPGHHGHVISTSSKSVGDSIYNKIKNKKIQIFKYSLYLLLF